MLLQDHMDVKGVFVVNISMLSNILNINSYVKGNSNIKGNFIISANDPISCQSNQLVLLPIANIIQELTATVPGITLRTNLIAYYGMEDLNDTSGNANDLTDTGGTILTTQAGINGALFDGTGATSIANATLALGSVWSFSCWVYVIDNTSNNEYPCMVGIGRAANTQLILVAGDYTSRSYWIYDQIVRASFGQYQAVSEGAWHHHLIVGDTVNGLRWFIDGTEISIGSPIYNLTKTGFQLGQDNVGQAFHGLIGPVSVWNRSLSPREAVALYNTGSPLALSTY